MKRPAMCSIVCVSLVCLFAAAGNPCFSKPSVDAATITSNATGMSIGDVNRMMNVREMVRRGEAPASADVDWLIDQLPSLHSMIGAIPQRRMDILVTLELAITAPLTKSMSERIYEAADPFLTGYSFVDTCVVSTMAAQLNEEKAIPRLCRLSNDPSRRVSKLAHQDLTIMAFNIVAAGVTQSSAPSGLPPADVERISKINSRAMNGKQPSKSDLDWLTGRLVAQGTQVDHQSSQRNKLLRSLVLATSPGVRNRPTALSVSHVATAYLTGYGKPATCSAAIIIAQLDDAKAVPQLRKLASSSDDLVKRAARYALLRMGVDDILRSE